MTRVGPLRATVVVATLLLTACTQSPEKKAEQARATLASWNATLELLSGELRRGAVADRFAEQVRRAADEERRKAQAR
jgi:hypothetical protein